MTKTLHGDSCLGGQLNVLQPIFFMLHQKMSKFQWLISSRPLTQRLEFL